MFTTSPCTLLPTGYCSSMFSQGRGHLLLEAERDALALVVDA